MLLLYVKRRKEEISESGFRMKRFGSQTVKRSMHHIIYVWKCKREKPGGGLTRVACNWKCYTLDSTFFFDTKDNEKTRNEGFSLRELQS